MQSHQPVPLWLWRGAAWGLGLTLIAIIALAGALSLGLADPPRAGPLLWKDDFKGGVARWAFSPPEGGMLAPEGGALLADFRTAAPDQYALGLTRGPGGDFTLEVACAQTSGAAGLQAGAACGLVFGWLDEANYSAVLVNGNGYAQVYGLQDGERTDWFEWQQWPHVLVGTASNRLRVDVRGEEVTLRINDERLAQITADSGGRIGLLARSSGPSRVVFSWVKLWAIP